jgi:hypothetical protein
MPDTSFRPESRGVTAGRSVPRKTHAWPRGQSASRGWLSYRRGQLELDTVRVVGYGPVVDPGELPAVLDKSVAEAALGATVVLDVHVGTYGYPGLSASVTGTSGASADGTSVR